MEDRLFGSVDVKKTLDTGETVFTPGLMANAHRGILYVDDINLVDDDLVTMMLQAVTDGFVIVEREGISVKYPCKPILIATLNPEDSELKDVFLDRIGISLNADTEPLSMEVQPNHHPSNLHPRNHHSRKLLARSINSFPSIHPINTFSHPPPPTPHPLITHHHPSSPLNHNEPLTTPFTPSPLPTHPPTPSPTLTTPHHHPSSPPHHHHSYHQDRVKAVTQVLAFSEGRMDKLELAEVYEKEEQLKAAIVFAREYLKTTKLSTAQLQVNRTPFPSP